MVDHLDKTTAGTTMQAKAKLPNINLLKLIIKEAMLWLPLFNLGVMYGRGRGMPIDYKEAVVWYRKAAEQGHAYAQYELGFMYVAGRGVTQGEVQARKWWSLAAKNGHTKAKDYARASYTNRQKGFHNER